jgi:serine/threonine-protein kinase
MVALAALTWGALSGRWPGSRTGGPGAGTAAAGAYEKVAEGRRLLERYDRPGNIDRAQAMFEAAYRELPGYAPAYVGLAEALWRQVDRDPDRAVLNRGLEAARKAIALEDQMASGHAVLGLLLMEAGEHDQARASVTRALQLDPKSKAALLAMSDVHVAAGDSPAAEASARKAVELYPDDWMVHSTLAYVMFRQSRFAEAAASFEQALERAPDSVRTLSNLAGIYHMLGRTEDAASMLQRAIEIAPSERAYSNLGTLRFFQGRYEESTQLFEKAVELAPNTYACWGNLGDARRWTLGQESRAAEAYASAISLVRKHLEARPGDKDAHASLASYLAKTGRTDEALAELVQAEDPEAADYFYAATAVYELAGQRDRALAALDRAMALGYSPVEIEADPELIALRRDRRFQELLAKHRQP